jgi:hypothetical protein
MTLCAEHKGIQLSYTYLDGNTPGAETAAAAIEDGTSLKTGEVSSNRAILKYKIPMSEIVTGFFDELKSYVHAAVPSGTSQR